MEKLVVPQFDHEAKGLSASLGLTDREVHYVRSAILFEALACPILAKELFDEDQAPANMTTMTGVMERVYLHMRNYVEQFYMTMIFADGWFNIQNAIKHSEQLGEREAEINELPEALKKMLSKAIGGPLQTLTGVTAQIRQSSFNFNEFVNIVLDDNNYDASGKYCPIEIEPNETDIKEVEEFMAKKLEAFKEKAEKLKKEKKAKKKDKKKSKDNPESTTEEKKDE